MGCSGGAIVSLDTVEFYNPAMSAGAAGMQARRDLPVFSGFSQFRTYILALEKQGFSSLLHQWFREADELV